MKNTKQLESFAKFENLVIRWGLRVFLIVYKGETVLAAVQQWSRTEARERALTGKSADPYAVLPTDKSLYCGSALEPRDWVTATVTSLPHLTTST